MADSRGFSIGFDTGDMSEKLAAYQFRLLVIARANLEFSFSYAQAIAAVKSPAEFTAVTSTFSQKQMEMLTSQTKELGGFAISKKT